MGDKHITITYLCEFCGREVQETFLYKPGHAETMQCKCDESESMGVSVDIWESE